MAFCKSPIGRLAFPGFSPHGPRRFSRLTHPPVSNLTATAPAHKIITAVFHLWAVQPMSDPAPNNERNRQILSAIVRAYIETGEPVSSRSISRRYVESLSSATIRNVMSDLEEQGFLYQPHTSAGRVPTAAAYRFFAQQIVARATLSRQDEDRIRGEFASANAGDEIVERAGHVLAEIS